MKILLKNLNHSPYFPHSTNIYICRVTIVLRMYDNVFLTFIFFFFLPCLLWNDFVCSLLSPLHSHPITGDHRPIAYLHQNLSSHFRSLQSLPILVFLAFLIALEIRKLMHCTNGTRPWYCLVSWHPAL